MILSPQKSAPPALPTEHPTPAADKIPVKSASRAGFNSSLRSSFAASSRLGQAPKQVCTLTHHPFATQACDAANDAVPTTTIEGKSIDDEPMALSVTERISAWEQICVKVRPPVKTPGLKPAASKSPARSTAKPPSGATPSRTLGAGGDKSFQDSTLERAPQVNPTASPANSSLGKSGKLSPTKASPAMKLAQQRLVQQTRSTDMAARLRQERMAEPEEVGCKDLKFNLPRCHSLKNK